jgi:alkanesulfonate monooxygenase SsuD/methylene tetrahydromethanopterin reductase-like flavin-dependent oxidoreductase (luciferase family)
VATNVANLPLRTPAVLARSVASLDLLSGGRVELGLGAGAFWDAIEAMGGRRLTPGEGVQALEEAIDVIRQVWDTTARGGVRVDGRHHHVHGAKRGPAPAHPVGIWVGAYKPRMLALTGRLADGWLPSMGYLKPGDLTAGNAAIDEAATAAGREPASVRRLLNITGQFLPNGRGMLQGPAEQWAEELADLALTAGTSTFILGSDDAVDLRRFAGEVAPAVRELVETERSTPSSGRPEQPPPARTAAPVAARATARVATAPFVVATPDSGARRSTEQVWDETTRPTGTVPDPTRTYTAHEQATGKHLIDVHDGLRAELTQLHDLVDQVAAGKINAGDARSHISQMTVRQNDWVLGAYCVNYCRVVTTHHTLEDQSLFPHLRAADPALRPVIDRLEQEHHVIHDVLERVDKALVAFVADPSSMETIRAAVDLLSDTLLSHLSYEERELVEPIARLGLR